MLLSQKWGSRLNQALGALLTATLDWRPLALAGLCALLTLLCAQAPLGYAFSVGVERGPTSDRPFLQSFYPTEGEWPDGLFRWSRGEGATIEFPGVGRRGMLLELSIASHRSQHFPDAPPTLLTLRSEGTATPPSFALRREGAHYFVYLPPEALSNGALRVQLDTPPWQNEGDSRSRIGVALAERVRLTSVRPGGFVLPDLALLFGLPLCLGLLWASVRLIGFEQSTSAFLLLPLALLAPLFLLVDAPRFGFIGPWAVQFGLVSLIATVVCLLIMPVVLQRFSAFRSPGSERWLILLMVLAFALKYGGRLYPESMPGDIQLHINRYMLTIFGDLAIEAKHRGLPFPFPPGYYFLLAPLTLTGLDPRTLFPILAGIFEAASLPLVYLLMLRVTGQARLAVLASAIYGLTATGFMNTWFSFHTQVSTQWFTALLMLLLATRWPQYHKPATWWVLVLVLIQMFVGHIGTFLNGLVLGALVVPVLWARATTPEQRRASIALLAAGATAAAFVGLFYYSVSAGLIAEQLGGIATRGLVEVSGKRPLPAAEHVWVLWEGGLITHYGFFPVLLAIPGVLALGRWQPRSVLPLLIWATFALTAAQAILPFLTQSAIQTRWLTFAAMAIAMASAAGVALIWRRGRMARVVVLAMAGYVCWISLVIWAEAMVWRLPPIEPF